MENPPIENDLSYNQWPVDRADPIQPRNNFEDWPQQPQRAAEAVASTVRSPLEFWNASDGTAKVKVKNGDMDNDPADAGMAGGADLLVSVSDGENVWIQFECERDVDSNAWTRTTAPVIMAGSLPAATAELAVCDLGSVTVVSNVVTVAGSVRRSSLSWERCGVDDAFTDKFLRG